MKKKTNNFYIFAGNNYLMSDKFWRDKKPTSDMFIVSSVYYYDFMDDPDWFWSWCS